MAEKNRDIDQILRYVFSVFLRLFKFFLLAKYCHGNITNPTNGSINQCSSSQTSFSQNNYFPHTITSESGRRPPPPPPPPPTHTPHPTTTTTTNNTHFTQKKFPPPPPSQTHKTPPPPPPPNRRAPFREIRKTPIDIPHFSRKFFKIKNDFL